MPNVIAVSVSSQIGENSCLGNKGERKMHLIRCMYFLLRPELTLKSVAFRLQNKACYYAKDGKSTDSDNPTIEQVSMLIIFPVVVP